ncbi:DUF4097 family beta strand repeat-containing protein [Cellulomonas sp. URHE0023]|uniref:DUF4097 family beta strand repeat-containing protein n=1 Tax=Cellulomonas sp. URHE0023 TaxID=1380354 RepID=UPI000484ED7F|nr:DUF4097 family beta strand repeat-containing protein [Cellulomonas sp. URHE0023]
MTTTLDRPPAPPQRSGGARALLWAGGIIGALSIAAGAHSLVDLLAFTYADSATVIATASYDAAPVVELVADGDITVTTGGAGIDVERTSRSASKHARYTASVIGDRLVVKHECDWWRPGFCAAGLNVTVPDGTAVIVRASDGSVEAKSLTGPVTVHTSDGSTTISDVDGDVSLRSADGRATITDVRGDVTARTSDGWIEVSDATGDVTTDTRDGRTTIASVQGDVDARAADGDVTVYGNGQPVALTISTNDGRQTIDAPTDPNAPVSIRIRTVDGDASYLGPQS